MKNLKIFLAITLLSFTAQADNLVCDNIDSQFQEDTLEFVQEGKQTVAYYFDNDSYYSIVCENTALDGYLCEDGAYTVNLSDSGSTTVSNGVDPDVEFYCY